MRARASGLGRAESLLEIISVMWDSSLRAISGNHTDCRFGFRNELGRSDRAVASLRDRDFLTSRFRAGLVVSHSHLPRLGGVGGEDAVDPQLVRDVLELLGVGLALLGHDHVGHETREWRRRRRRAALHWRSRDRVG